MKNRRGMCTDVLLCGFLAVAAAPGVCEDPDHLVREANRKYHAGDYRAAADSYFEVIRQTGETPELLYNLGTVYYGLGRYAEAAGLFGRSLDVGGEGIEADANYSLGNCMYRLGMESASRIGMAGDEHPEGEPGPARQALHSFEEAEERFRTSLLREPGERDSQRNLELSQIAIDRIRSILTQTPPPPDTPRARPEQATQTGTPPTPTPGTPPTRESRSESTGTTTQIPPTPPGITPLPTETSTPEKPRTPTPSPELLSPEAALELLENLAEEIHVRRVRQHTKEGKDW